MSNTFERINSSVFWGEIAKIKLIESNIAGGRKQNLLRQGIKPVLGIGKKMINIFLGEFGGQDLRKNRGPVKN